ncbi:uncharacterized protein [Aegilops tauschii subsp. strangulata]|uniref:uncharacterized protein isoform X4 n=1 Tax=Aegilops tauschii subsp. strangulata TaxID=200361 RepID=UPI003CC8528F
MRRFVDAQQSLQTAMLNNVNSSGSLDWSWYMIHLKLGLGTGYILSWSSSLSSEVEIGARWSVTVCVQTAHRNVTGRIPLFSVQQEVHVLMPLESM